MNNEPTIVILKKSLDKHRKLFLNVKKEESNKNKDKNIKIDFIMDYLSHVYQKHDIVSIGGIELFLCSPQFLNFNKQVRDKLDELNIEYSISN